MERMCGSGGKGLRRRDSVFSMLGPSHKNEISNQPLGVGPGRRTSRGWIKSGATEVGSKRKADGVLMEQGDLAERPGPGEAAQGENRYPPTLASPSSKFGDQQMPYSHIPSRMRMATSTASESLKYDSGNGSERVGDRRGPQSLLGCAFCAAKSIRRPAQAGSA